MGTPVTIDVFDRQPAFDVLIEEIENDTQQKIFEYRPITGPRNRKYRKLCYPDHPNEIPQPHQSMGLLDKVRELRELVQNLSNEVRQNKKSQDDFQESVEVDRKFSEMVQGSSPLFAVQDVVKELLKACDDETRKYFPKFELQKRFEQRALPGANQLPAAYQWLLEQSENGDTNVQACLKKVHSNVKVMSETPFDVKSMLASLPSHTEAKTERDWRCHPCSLSDKFKMEDIIKFVKKLAEGDEPLPKPYKNSDRELVKKAVSHWSKTHDQEAGPSGTAKPTKVERSKRRF